VASDRVGAATIAAEMQGSLGYDKLVEPKAAGRAA
jgi:hypothetical protein